MGEPVIVPWTGEVDATTHQPFLNVVGAATTAALAADTGVVVDLRGVTFMGSAGFSALVRNRNRLSVHGQALRVRDPDPVIRRAMELLGLDDLLDEPPV